MGDQPVGLRHQFSATLVGAAVDLEAARKFASPRFFISPVRSYQRRKKSRTLPRWLEDVAPVSLLRVFLPSPQLQQVQRFAPLTSTVPGYVFDSGSLSLDDIRGGGPYVNEARKLTGSGSDKGVRLLGSTGKALLAYTLTPVRTKYK